MQQSSATTHYRHCWCCCCCCYCCASWSLYCYGERSVCLRQAVIVVYCNCFIFVNRNRHTSTTLLLHCHTLTHFCAVKSSCMWHLCWLSSGCEGVKCHSGKSFATTDHCTHTHLHTNAGENINTQRCWPLWAVSGIQPIHRHSYMWGNKCVHS